MDPLTLVAEIRQGNRRSLARAITLLENQHETSDIIINQLDYHNPDCQVIGITGPPGSGKSTLVNELITSYRADDLTVAIVAVDPSSPFSGGAILGDRIRMLSKTSDPGVFIRSLASRGRLGGLSPYTFDVITLLMNAEFDRVIVETVGAGQSEIDIIKNADTTVVLAVPGLGDDIQVIKAGIMEVADVFAVNKSDIPDAQVLKQRITNMLDLVPSKEERQPPVILISALHGTAIDKLRQSLDEHFDYLQETNKLETNRSQRLSNELLNKLQHRLFRTVDRFEEKLLELSSAIIQGEISIQHALEELTAKYFSQSKN